MSAFTLFPCLLGYLPLAFPSPAPVLLLICLLVAPLPFYSIFLVSCARPGLPLMFFPPKFETFSFCLVYCNNSHLLPPTCCDFMQIISLLSLVVFKDPFNSVLLWTLSFFSVLFSAFFLVLTSCFLFFLFLDLSRPHSSDLPFSPLGKGEHSCVLSQDCLQPLM